MTQINLFEFTDYDIAIMAEFLQLDKTGCYQITIKRDIPLAPYYIDPNFYDYLLAAYTGHLLSLASSEFSYDVPCRFTKKPFSFKLRSKQHVRIAAILSDACKLFFDELDHYPQLLTAAENHYNDSLDAEYCVGAAGLIVVAEEIARDELNGSTRN